MIKLITIFQPNYSDYFIESLINILYLDLFKRLYPNGRIASIIELNSWSFYVPYKN